MKYRISSNDNREWLLLISPKKGPIIQETEIIRGRQLFQIFLTGSSILNILFYYPIKLKKKKITSNKLNMSFLSVPNLVSLFNIQCQYPQRQSLNRHWSVLLDQTPLQLDREGIKEREGGKRGGGGRLSGGMAIIRGNMVVCPLNCKSSFFEHGRPIVLIVFRFIFWDYLIDYYSIVFCILFCIYFISLRWKVFLIIFMEIVL